jgi:ATP-binding cassette subfamily B protein
MKTLYSVVRIWLFLYRQEKHRMVWGPALALTGLYVTFTAWISKYIIDSLTQPRHAIIPGVHNALFFGAIYGLVTLIHSFISSYAAVEILSVKDRISSAADQLLMDRAAASFDITAFEVPETRDRIRLATAGGRALSTAFSGSIDFLQQLVSLIGVSVILAYYHFLLVVLVLAPSIPFFYMQMKTRMYTFAAMVNKSPEHRRMGYFIGLMLGSESAKEVRAYRSGSFFLGKYERVADHIVEFARLHRWKATLVTMVWGNVAAAGIGGAYLYVIYLAAHGMITVGDVVMYSGAVFYAGMAMRGLVQSTSTLSTDIREAHAFFDYLDSRESSAGGNRVATAQPQNGEEWIVNHVSFSYPGRSGRALDDVSFTIHKNEKIAIVGLNGAGKTTLIKLLLRLMDPERGTIMFRGADLKDWDINAFRQSIGVVFQDFSRFKLSLYENIALALKKGSNLPEEDDAVFQAARLAQVDQIAQVAPRGYQTLLSNEFQDGIDLSGGQWQKIALARGFARDSDVMIFDEPNSSLDVKTEQAIFSQMLALAKHKTAVIASHRLSLTRMVDRVLVFDGGRLVEDGSHNQLIALDGKYAKIYRTQAAMYWPNGG